MVVVVKQIENWHITSVFIAVQNDPGFINSSERNTTSSIGWERSAMNSLQMRLRFPQRLFVMCIHLSKAISVTVNMVVAIKSVPKPPAIK